MKKKFWLILIAPFAIALFIWVGGEIVMHLWNWLLPGLFGWKVIGFWQALGLLALSRILFGGWGHGHQHDKHRGGWAKTPEERERFRLEMRARWCGQPAPPAEPAGPAS